MHDGMQYDAIQGQGQGYEHLKVGKSAIFKGYLLPPPFIMGAGKLPRILRLRHNTYSLSGRIFLFFCPSFCHVTLNLAVSTRAQKVSSISMTFGM